MGEVFIERKVLRALGLKQEAVIEATRAMFIKPIEFTGRNE